MCSSDLDTSLKSFTLGLDAVGYTLVHVGKRLVDKDSETQYVLRYTFGRIAHENESLRALGYALSGELENYVGEAMFNVQAFRNPLYREGKEVAGQNVITIDVNGRKPLYRKVDGKKEPVTVWSGGRDALGKGIGEKVALAPKHFLDVDIDMKIAIFFEPELEAPVQAEAS